MAMTTVLVIEDDARVAAVIADQLRADDHRVAVARGVNDGLAQLEATQPDVVVLDVNLPDGSGFDLARRIRRGGAPWDAGLGILMLTARTEEADLLRGFERGADDYLTKPFSFPELCARVRALATRGRPPSGTRLMTVGRLEVDAGTRVARWDGQAVELAAKEFDLLVELAVEPGIVLSKAELLRRVWNSPATLQTRTVDSHASRLRRKLLAAGVPTDPIANKWGRGYALEIAAA